MEEREGGEELRWRRWSARQREGRRSRGGVNTVEGGDRESGHKWQFMAECCTGEGCHMGGGWGSLRSTGTADLGLTAGGVVDVRVEIT